MLARNIMTAEEGGKDLLALCVLRHISSCGTVAETGVKGPSERGSGLRRRARSMS